MAPRKAQPKKVRLNLEGGIVQDLSVAADFKSGDVLIEVDSPHSWVTIPTSTGGEFSVRAGLVMSMHVEDEANIRG